MAKRLIPTDVSSKYKIFEWHYAASILHSDFPEEFSEIIEVLRSFELIRSDIVTPGGRKSPIATRLDSKFYEMGWIEKSFDIKTKIDGNTIHIPTHSIDCFKNGIGVEVEWNNKDPFYDRDLNNFRLLFELKALDVGVIITRDTELQHLFDSLGKGKSYGTSTTHWNKLIPRIEGQGAGGCPVLVFGITTQLYRDDL